MKRLYVFLAFVSLYGNAQAPVEPAPPAVSTPAPAPESKKEWDVSFYGFVRSDYIMDTRKSAQVREYQVNLYPLDESLDANGVDINKTGASNFLAIVSRLGVKVKGPDVWGAKMTGVLEGDFFGTSEATVGSVRLRHGYINMDWSKTTVILGQTWYPSVIPELMPGVANFNAGIMFNPFGWATQFRIKQNFTQELSLAITAYKERVFPTPVPGGAADNSASTNSMLPIFHGQLQFKNKFLLAGAGIEYKSLQPLNSYKTTETTPRTLATTEKVNSTTFLGYFKYTNDLFTIKGYGISGKNLNSFVMLGGYIGYALPGEVEKYEAIKTNAFWFDVASNHKTIAPGLFFGQTSNLGTGKTDAEAKATPYMRGVSGSRVVDNVWRGSARVDFKKNGFRVTPEYEYTVAKWGDAKQDGTADGNFKDLANSRVLVSCVYTF